MSCPLCGCFVVRPERPQWEGREITLTQGDLINLGNLIRHRSLSFGTPREAEWYASIATLALPGCVEVRECRVQLNLEETAE